MVSILVSLEKKIVAISDQVESISDVATTLIETLNTLINTINSIFIPIVITLLCINALNMGVVIWCIDRPQYDSYVNGKVNDGELYTLRESGKRECKINVQYVVKGVRYDYTFVTMGKNNYINRDKVRVYYNRGHPQQPSLVRNKPMRGKIIIMSSVLVTSLGWMGWWLFLKNY